MDDKTDRIAIPLVEEELKIGRREIETGRVTVRTVSDEHTEFVSEDLRHSQAEVDRVFIDREVTELPQIREEGDLLIVPVVEERLVKRLFLVEEVRVRRKVVTERLEKPVTLRSQRVVVDRQEGSGQHIEQEN
jgi:stress response protein YsnF